MSLNEVSSLAGADHFAMDWDKLDLLLWELAQLKTGAISLP